MNKKLVSLAIAVALIAPMVVSADISVYGKVKMNVNATDTDHTTASGNKDTNIWDINSKKSRLGAKVAEDLGDNLIAVARIELGINIAEQDNEFSEDTGETVTGRNTFVGLVSRRFGTVLIGRHDTPLKITTAKLDLFRDTAADYNHGNAGRFVDRRADGTIAYISPNLAGATIAAAIIPGENASADGLADAYSVAVMYSNGGIYVSAAIEAGTDKIDAILGAMPAVAADLTQTRFSLSYDTGSFLLGGIYENSDLDNLGSQTSRQIFGQMRFGNSSVAAKWFDVEIGEETAAGNAALGGSGVVADRNIYSKFGEAQGGWAIKVQQNLSKRTFVYATYTAVEGDAVDGRDMNILGVGIHKSFY